MNSENEVRYKAIDAGLVLAKMEQAKSDINKEEIQIPVIRKSMAAMISLRYCLREKLVFTFPRCSPRGCAAASQIAITLYSTATLAALADILRSMVAKPEQEELDARCRASAKSIPCSYQMIV